VTIADAARCDGNSAAAVSHVLDSMGRIGKGTRSRVFNALKGLDRSPNLYAPDLARRGSRMMGIIYLEKRDAGFERQRGVNSIAKSKVWTFGPRVRAVIGTPGVTREAIDQ